MEAVKRHLVLRYSADTSIIEVFDPFGNKGSYVETDSYSKYTSDRERWFSFHYF